MITHKQWPQRPSICISLIITTIYLLTPWTRVLLEKLTGFQLVKKFPAFYGTRRFITTVTSTYHLSLTWASSIQSTPPHPTSWRSIFHNHTHHEKYTAQIIQHSVSGAKKSNKLSRMTDFQISIQMFSFILLAISNCHFLKEEKPNHTTIH